MFEKALLGADTYLAQDPRTGAWVTYDPWELPDDGMLACGVLPDGLLDGLDLPDDAPPGSVSLEATPTGPGLAARLAEVELTAASTYDVVEAAGAWARLASWVAAGQAAALAELTGRPELRPGESGYRSVNPVTNAALEVAARTVTTTRQAENQVGHAVQLVEDFPATWAALSAGLIDERRARLITGELGTHDVAIRRRVEAAVLPAAPDLDTVALRRRIVQLLHQLAPATAEQRCQEARERRDVTLTPAPDAMAHLEAYLPAEDAIAVRKVLDAAADTLQRLDTAGERQRRTAGQRRADALAAMAWQALNTQQIGGAGHRLGCACTCGRAHDEAAGPPDGEALSSTAPPPIPLASAHGRPVAVQLTFPFRALVGLSDEPAELAGYGPIPAQVARHLAAVGIWQWVGTDPVSGHLVDHGAGRYRPTQALIDHVVLRDRTCRAVGCHRPAIHCDIDHRVAHGAGGPTNACNCQPLCRLHHLLKHRGGWRVDRLPSGATAWLSPTGHRYLKPPEPIGPTTAKPPDPGDQPPF
ncbi:HNH endonuclease signature motif containing protein [Jiangella gansuensis]|uniref:HNH endonuclease signature motif containing protein n=1 Tax=Jiangella gansuensis TaxID=281473 RepID=UPI000479E899|nr:HNH endonuclease signature motif containing protein [Jiangella gansuensis]